MSQHPRDNFEFRRKAQKVFVDRATGDVVLRLHATEIVRVRPNGDVVLSTGGWATHKTLSSMNDALELFAMWVEAPSRNPPDGHWQVTDSDGTTVIPYAASSNQPKTIPARSADDKQRGQWLAEAYEVPYTPPPAAAGPRIAAAAPSGPRTVAQQPAPAASASAASSAQANGIGGSWANVARQATPTYQATSGATAAHPGRVTGPGRSAAGRVTGPGAAAAAGPTRPSGPPGFSTGPSSSSSGAGGAIARAAQPAWPASSAAGQASVTAAPPAPMNQQLLEQHMAQMGITDDDDAHVCVVCMEEPRSIVLVPCGHMALCKDCCQTIIVEQQKKCPMCQQDVEYHVEVDA